MGGLVALAGLALLGATGCANSLVMDTARALPAGESTVLLGGGAGRQRGAMIVYDSPTHEDWPQWRTDEPTSSVPEWPFQFEWLGRWSRGLGAGFQLDVQVTMPMPVGLGVGVGLKWQLPLPDDGPLAIAAVTRGLLSLAGHSSGGFGASFLWGTFDPGAIVSVHFSETQALYLSPRVRWDSIHHRSWVDDAVDGAGGSARGWSAALGWQLGAPRRGALYLEATLVYSPATEGLRGVFGIGGAIPSALAFEDARE
jgi:hypothetical protein